MDRVQFQRKWFERHAEVSNSIQIHLMWCVQSDAVDAGCFDANLSDVGVSLRRGSRMALYRKDT